MHTNIHAYTCTERENNRYYTSFKQWTIIDEISPVSYPKPEKGESQHWWSMNASLLPNTCISCKSYMYMHIHTTSQYRSTERQDGFSHITTLSLNIYPGALIYVYAYVCVCEYVCMYARWMCVYECVCMYVFTCIDRLNGFSHISSFWSKTLLHGPNVCMLNFQQINMDIHA
jgi:hypothetical protein